MSDDPKGRSALAVWLIVALVLLPLYVLSAGPAHWLAYRGYVSGYVGVIYLPLYPIVASSETIEKAAAWYMKKWE